MKAGFSSDANAAVVDYDELAPVPSNGNPRPDSGITRKAGNPASHDSRDGLQNDNNEKNN